MQEGGKWYLYALNGGTTNFDYEDINTAGYFDGITFQFRDSLDVNDTGRVYQQLVGTVELNDVEPETVVLPTLAINDVTVAEGNGGTTTPTAMVFTVTRTGDLTAASSADWTLAHGTTAAGDFTGATSGTVIFAAGAATATITVNVVGDTAVEGNETFTINLSNATGATITDASGAGTITNDDAVVLPTLAINDVSVAEGNGGTTTPTAMVFTVTRTGDLTAASSANWTLAHGTTAAGDFTGATSGTVTFAAGAATATITVNVVGDTAVEGNETFTINLSNATGATITDASGAGTVTNDDAVVLPTLAINDVSVAEGNGGTTTPTAMVFTVTRTGDLTAASSADWTLAHGTTAAADFTGATNGTVAFAAGAATATITVNVVGDTAVEGNETFTINLSNAAGATITDASGTGTITNDDAVVLPTLAINDVSVAEGNGGTTTPTAMVFTVTRTGDLTAASSADWTLAHGTTAAADFTGVTSGTVAFAAGAATATITVNVVGDTAVEGNETFTVNLSNATGATITDASGAGTITNDDAVVLPTLAINDVSVAEGNGGTTTPTAMVFTVTRTGDLTAASSADWTLAHGTTAAGDFTDATSGTVTFAAGAATATITVNVVGDTAVEGNETFTINLSNAAGATITDASGAGTITNDDAVVLPTLAINDVTVAEGNGGTTTPTAMVFTVTRTGDLTAASSAELGAGARDDRGGRLHGCDKRDGDIPGGRRDGDDHRQCGGRHGGGGQRDLHHQPVERRRRDDHRCQRRRHRHQ